MGALTLEPHDERLETQRRVAGPAGPRQGWNLGRIFERRLLAHLALLVAVALGALGPALVEPGDPPAPDPRITYPTMPWSPVEALVLQHRCWTGDAPKDAPVPRHAIVTLPGRLGALVPARVGFDIWLGTDGVPATGDERLGIVHAFCP